MSTLSTGSLYGNIPDAGGASAPTDALVFFGATGDLAYKKIFPALQRMIKRGNLDVPIIGVAKAGWNLDQFRARAKDSLVLPSYITTFYASKRWLGKNKFFFGIDYAYHSDVYAFLKNYGVDRGHEMGHAWDGAFLVGNEFMIGRLGLVGQVGVYYHQTYLKFDPVYEKIGGNYYIIQHEHGILKELFVSAMLLTHEIVAEYGEIGIGAGF